MPAINSDRCLSARLSQAGIDCLPVLCGIARWSSVITTNLHQSVDVNLGDPTWAVEDIAQLCPGSRIWTACKIIGYDQLLTELFKDNLQPGPGVMAIGYSGWVGEVLSENNPRNLSLSCERGQDPEQQDSHEGSSGRKRTWGLLNLNTRSHLEPP